ncbi:hypothetical protein IMCC3135_13580 [Granulosicoccus antarcticus IMCC3135]|uniref:Uncharacterized protein n=1 Tax=Granulosicoccus antarcticus IMCC3135 TaxID=1192854 RepID=A0A2Z2NS21_9GAMM|nr:hypothetical protein IMCC3135_13580 [Granulosicoccus antarcticus IMCC3135]
MKMGMDMELVIIKRIIDVLDGVFEIVPRPSICKYVTRYFAHSLWLHILNNAQELTDSLPVSTRRTESIQNVGVLQ